MQNLFKNQSSSCYCGAKCIKRECANYESCAVYEYDCALFFGSDGKLRCYICDIYFYIHEKDRFIRRSKRLNLKDWR
jgi:hypothetical protein